MSLAIGLPQFSNIQLQHFKTHLEAMLQGHLQRVEDLLQGQHAYTWENLVYPLEEMADELERFWSPLSHLHAVMDSPELRACYDACLPSLSAYEVAMGQNTALYKALQAMDSESLNPVQKKIIADNLRDFKLSGVNLPEAEKKRLEVIETRLDELTNQFEHNILDATQAFTLPIENTGRLAGVPEHALQTAQECAEKKKLPGYLLTLDYPCYQAVMTYADDRSLREEMYQAYVTRASDQGPNAGQFDNSALMNEILALRHEEALLLGFANYAELSLATKMADSPAQVLHFMNGLIEKAYPQAQQEFKALEEFAMNEGQIESLKPWDMAYFSEKRRQALFNLSQEELRPYFPQPRVMDGLFALVKQLYGMTIEEIKGVDVWHPDVQCYCVADEHNQVRGYVYTDLFARPHKQGGAWMDSLQSRRRLENGSVQFPIATLSCNFAKTATNKPALLSHEEVVTLFHEFGHCLHHILTQVDYMDASGINGVEWDAVELPSQFFENWCWEPNALTVLSAHVDTGEVLPDDLYQRVIAAKNFQSAMAMLRQMEFSIFDFRIHQEYDSQQDRSFIARILNEVRAKTSISPQVPYNRFQHSFSHIFAGGYAAGYYSYSWAEVLSSDAFSRFEEEGILNAKTGRDFLHFILEAGGSKKAAQAYEQFRGRPATIDALLRHNGIQA